MSFDLICAGERIHFQGLSSVNLWNTWQWKLDPWKVSDNKSFMHKTVQEEVEICFESCLQKEAACEEKAGKLVFRETSGFFETQVFLLETGEVLWKLVRVSEGKSYLEFCVDSQWKKLSVEKDLTQTEHMAAFEYISKILPGIFLKRGLLSLHGVLMEYQGNGLILSAPSGTGKTTHARLWRDLKNAFIINGDRSVVQRMEEEWVGHGIPWSGTSGEQMNRSVPLKCVVVLERGEQNEVSQLHGMEAFGAIMPHVLYPSWDRTMVELMMGELEALLREIPVVRLRCQPDEESVEVLCQMLKHFL